MPEAGHTDAAPRFSAVAKRSLVLIGILALLVDWPILRGKVPFPAHGVIGYPPWDSVRPADFHRPTHAEMGDLVTELYPWKAYARHSAEAGTIPLWNPHLLLGAPFAGDPQTGLFYPPNLLYAVLPTPTAWSLSVLLRTVLAGVLASLLAAALGAEGAAASLAGVVFAFCGWVTAFQTRPHLDTSLWLPLVLLSVDRLQKKPRASSTALAAVAFALPVVAGQPENAFHATLIGVIFFLYRLAWPADPTRSASRERRRFAMCFAAAGVFAIVLAAVQIFPALEFIGQLDRNLGEPWGAKPLHEAAAFFSRDLGANPNSAGVPIPESAAYAGMLTLLLAPLAFLHRNRRDAIFFAALAFVCIEIVYGLSPGYPLSIHTPILRGIPNGRLLVVVDLCLGVLAALGLSAVNERARERRRVPVVGWALSLAAVLLSAVAVALLWGREAPGGARWLSLATFRGPLASAAMLAVSAGLLILGLSGRIASPLFGRLALACVALDLATASYAFFPYARPGEIFPPAPAFDFLKRDRQPNRVAALDQTWGPGFELVYDLDSATGYTVLLRRLIRYWAPLGLRPDSPFLKAERVVASPTRLLDLANVKYLGATTWNDSARLLASRPDRFRLVFSDGTARIFENLTALPRAFLVPVSGALMVADEDAALAAVSSPAFDPARTAIVSAPVSVPGMAARAQAVSPVGVGEYTQKINEVGLRAVASEPSILVVSQMHYPGWKAFVDGRETPLLRVDYTFAGVALAPGAHAVRLVYEPASLRLGVAISGVGLLVLLAIFLVGRRESADRSGIIPKRRRA